MASNYDFHSVLTSATGDPTSEQSVTRTVNFDRYEIEIELSTSGQFLGIVSVKVQKAFIESFKKRHISDVHDVEEYYNKDE